MSWAEEAACRGEDFSLFFPDGESANKQQIEQAMEFCNRCPVADECLDEALERPEQYGIWGGLTEDDRRTLRRSLARKKVS